MDIIDIMLARALTPQGQIESYAAQSRTAVSKANSAVSAIEEITEQTNANNEAAQEALTNAQTALDNATEAEARMNTVIESIQDAATEQIHDEIDKLAYALSRRSNSSVIDTDLVVSNPSGQATTLTDLYKMYRSTGNNEDGTMTQKAITDALAQKANSSDTVTKAYVDQAIASIPSGGASGISNLGVDAAGHIVIVGPDGKIKAGSTTETEIIEALINSDSYGTAGALGLIVDYENKAYERTSEASNLHAGADFNKYSMYGGRMRCNVADNGEILAFYGDNNYTEDGSNGQVMIYQPKFYYKRSLLKTDTWKEQEVIRKELLMVSAEEKEGFKLHPLFQNGLEYVLLPAYEGSFYDTSAQAYITNDGIGVDTTTDKLSSIAQVKPATCKKNNLTLEDLQTLARNRGEGWSITNMESESALQMLSVIELGAMNTQAMLDEGIVDISSVTGVNCSSLTGSTASLGNNSGFAAETINEINNISTTFTESGKRAISYRGMENPWGNTWRFIGNCQIRGNGAQSGGVIYIDNQSTGLTIPNTGSWISAMGYKSDDYDWLFIPAEFSEIANSAVPVGDNIWIINNLSGVRLVAIGGAYNARNNAGMFFYGCDMATNASPVSYNGRLMYIPTENAVYTANINKWRQHYGG